jgi:chemotaxis protein MotB
MFARKAVCFLALLPLITGGCVLKSKYDEALLQIDDLDGQLATCLADGEDLDAQLRECSAAKKMALGQIDDLISQLEETGQDVSRLQIERDGVAQSLVLAEQELAELERKRALEKARMATFRNMLQQFQAMIDSGQIEVVIDRGRMIVKMPSGILFDSGKTQIKAEGKEVLAEVTAVLASLPDRTFQVEGHTDDQPIQTSRFPSNWELSVLRATEVVKFMVDEGMPPQRILPSGHAEFVPVGGNDTPEGRALNRRIEIVLMPNMAELPDLSSLERVD